MFKSFRKLRNYCRVYGRGQFERSAVIRGIIEEQEPTKNGGDAFYVMDLGYFVEAAERWRRLLPRVHPFYAVKANPDPVLLQMMKDLQFGFDCASMNEIEMILDGGSPPSRIVYAHTRKQPSHLKFASSAGVTLTTFDDVDELQKVSRIAPEMGLLLRISTSSFNSHCASAMNHLMTRKFGCRLDETRGLLEVAKQLGSNVKGVSFHVGSRCTDPSAFARAIDESGRVFAEGSQLGFDMSILDIGGGLPCTTRNNYCSPEYPFDSFAAVIRKSLEESFPEGSGVAIIAEPGAYFCLPSTVIVANIIGKRDNRHRTDRCEHDAALEYTINDGVYSAFSDYRLTPGLRPVIQPVSEEYTMAPLYKCKIWGQTCDGDLITENCQLPDMKTGDWLYSPDCGAYSTVFCTNFNGFGLPRVHRYVSESSLCRFHAMKDELNASATSANFQVTRTPTNGDDDRIPAIVDARID